MSENTKNQTPKSDNSDIAIEYAGKAGGIALTGTQQVLGLWRWFIGFIGLMLIYNPTTILYQVSYFYWVKNYPGYITDPGFSITSTGWLQITALIFAMLGLIYAYTKITRKLWLALSIAAGLVTLLMAGKQSGIISITGLDNIILSSYVIFSIVLGFMLNRLRLDRMASGAVGINAQGTTEVEDVNDDD